MDLIIVQGGYLNGASRCLTLMQEFVQAYMTGKTENKGIAASLSKHPRVAPSSVPSLDDPSIPCPVYTVFVFCELFVGGYSDANRQGGFESCAYPDGSFITFASQLAGQYKCGIVFGYAESATINNQAVVFDAACLVGPTGTPMLNHRKTTLWGDYERKYFHEGDNLTAVAQMGALKIGLAICYEVEFPEVSRILTLKGATVVLAPTAAGDYFLQSHMIPTRAYENGIYLAYVNRARKEETFDFSGNSIVCAPDGSTSAFLAHDQEFDPPNPNFPYDSIENANTANPPGLPKGMGVIRCYCDPKVILSARTATPYLVDRRPELYTAICEPKYQSNSHTHKHVHGAPTRLVKPPRHHSAPGARAIITDDFKSEHHGELTVKAGEHIHVLRVVGAWIEAKTHEGKHGWVPASYVLYLPNH